MKARAKMLRFISLFMLCLLVYMGNGGQLVALAASSSSSSADESQEELQERLKELQEQQKAARERINAANASIEEGENAAAAAQARKSALEEEQRLIEEQIALKIQEIDLKVAEIDQKTLEISEKQIEFDENERLLKQRLIAIYKMNDASILSTLLMVDSFADFMAIYKNLQVIMKNDTDLLDTLETQRIELEAAKAELETLLADLQAEREALNLKWEEYNANIAQQNANISNAMAQIAQSEADKEAALAEYEAMQNEMEDIWKNLGGSAGSYVGGALEWPVPSHNGSQYVSSTYGWRTLYGRANFHTGVDIATRGGSPINGVDIVAANTGTVVLVSTSNSRTGYGYYLIVDHGGGVKTLYAHCSAIYVSVGTTVSRGQAIAAVGNTGNSTGPHLHFELRLNNTEKTDPWPYLTGSKEL